MPKETVSAGASGEPSEAEVRRRLAAMLDAEAFRQSPQLCAFLNYIVEETLAGRGPELKGYSIATMALGRPESFDPQADPIVRVQAGRLRQAMAAYHEAHPADDVAILLDKGVYAPRFVRRSGAAAVPALAAQVAPPAPLKSRKLAPWMGAAVAAALAVAGIVGWRSFAPSPAADAVLVERAAPSLTVEANLAGLPAEPELMEMVERARDAAARFDDLVVVRDGAAGRRTVSGRGAAAGPRLTLKIALVGGGRRYAARLIDEEEQAVLWSQDYDAPPSGAAGDAGRTRIVRAIVTAIAQPYGVIHAHLRARLGAHGGTDGPHGCIVAAFDYWRINDAATHRTARDCLMQRISEMPTLGGLHAQLTYLHLEEHRQGYNPLPGNPLDRALDSANRAVTHAPASARSHQALLAAHFARGETESAWRAAARAMALNPFDTEIEADVGARYVQSGQAAKGLAMIDEALEMNPAPPAWALTFRALALYLEDRLDRSVPIASSLKGTAYAPAMMALLMVARQNRDEAAAREALADLRRLHPAILEDPEGYLRRLAFDPGVIARIGKDFRTSRDWAANLP